MPTYLFTVAAETSPVGPVQPCPAPAALGLGCCPVSSSPVGRCRALGRRPGGEFVGPAVVVEPGALGCRCSAHGRVHLARRPLRRRRLGRRRARNARGGLGRPGVSRRGRRPDRHRSPPARPDPPARASLPALLSTVCSLLCAVSCSAGRPGSRAASPGATSSAPAARRGSSIAAAWPPQDPAAKGCGVGARRRPEPGRASASAPADLLAERLVDLDQHRFCRSVSSGSVRTAVRPPGRRPVLQEPGLHVKRSAEIRRPFAICCRMSALGFAGRARLAQVRVGDPGGLGQLAKRDFGLLPLLADVGPDCAGTLPGSCNSFPPGACNCKLTGAGVPR